MGTRASPVNGVANGGKMDTKKKGDVGYPGAYQEQGRDAQEDKKQRTSKRRMKLLARGDDQGKCYEKPFARKKTTT